MTRRRLTFRKTDVVRAFESARKAGIKHPRVEIDLKRSVIAVADGDPPKDTGDTTNPWDEVLGHAAPEKQPA